MRLKLVVLFSFLIIQNLCIAQEINLQGAWKVFCGLETSVTDGSISTCTLCEIQKSEIAKYKNQFIIRFDTSTSTLTLLKYGLANGISVPYLLFPKEKQFQFTVEGNNYFFYIIKAGNAYILKEFNENCYLVIEKIGQ